MKRNYSNKLINQLSTVFWITVIWTLFSLYQVFSGYATLVDFNCSIGELGLPHYVKGALLTGILAGIIGGSAVVFIWEKWLRSKNYGRALLHMFLSYCIIYLLVAIPSDIFSKVNENDLSVFDPELLKIVMGNVFSFGQVQSFLTWLVIVLSTMIALQIGDKYGPGVFRSFLLGKYFQPQREERIFMFLDLRSSTTIAEKLGEVRYFNFIRNVFRDVTPAILYSKGEIYQYVGDEIVISWRMDNGLENANCVNCFFEVQAMLNQQKEYYDKTYDGMQPEFKAGLHYGYVMAGEVGVVKRDIAYSGDVLNTTARIQSKCNEFGVNILLSKYLLDKLSFKTNAFHPKVIGDIMLRGKQEKVALCTL